jgi:hypothetical protein
MTESPTPSREDIIALREQGLNREEIASYYRVSLSRVKRWIRDLIIPVSPKRQYYKRPVSNGRVDDELTLIEQSRITLGKRMGQDYRGYLLDGRPVRIDVLIRAAGLKIPDVP